MTPLLLSTALKRPPTSCGILTLRKETWSNLYRTLNMSSHLTTYHLYFAKYGLRRTERQQLHQHLRIKTLHLQYLALIVVPGQILSKVKLWTMDTKTCQIVPWILIPHPFLSKAPQFGTMQKIFLQCHQFLVKLTWRERRCLFCPVKSSIMDTLGKSYLELALKAAQQGQ